MYYIVDEGPSANPAAAPSWYVAARDAFNGALLWKRPMDSWANHMRKFRSGPVQLPRTLVTAGGKVYLPLGLNTPVSVLDGKTGELLGDLPGTSPAEEIIIDGGMAFAVTGAPITEQSHDVYYLKARMSFPNRRAIVAVSP